MPLGLLGTKVGMTQVYDENGKVAPVTVLQLGPCPVLQIRTPERDGYHAIQLGFKDKPRKNSIRAERGHVANDLESKRRKKRQGQDIPKKADVEPQRLIREFRLDAPPTQEVGAKITVADIFTGVKAVDVIGRTKGRGFAGVIKRWGFGGLPAAHGAKKVHREVGSTSSLASNRGSGRPKKGKKLPGRYGNEQVTIRNLDVISVDLENNLILVRGAVPGFNGAYVMVRPTNKK
ncbi:50S ribosomal protein L3 [Zavarzinella formosa]|uniref:50S ribosomal protein L3 n=1 Tax=Zavarzinella formosa TaxID=360055 RepID=UPI0002E406E4|nr:50S ribosomal protein L3 [Zavarzinella formosa]